MLEQPTTAAVQHGFEFRGNARDYFGIWIVNLVLTILTLGIYSAWAKVRTNRYFYSNTVVAGSAFDYTADPRRILIGRAIAVAMIAVYQVCILFYPAIAGYVLLLFLCVLPFIYLSSIAFKMRYSQWRNINFGFERDIRGAYLLFAPILGYIAFTVAGPLLFGIDMEELITTEEELETSSAAARFLMLNTAIALLGMLFFPLWQSLYYRFIGSRVKFGQSKMSLKLKARSFYAMYFGMVMLGILGAILLVTVIGAMMAGTMDNVEQPEQVSTTSIAAVYMAGLFPYVIIFAYLKTRLTNMLYNGLRMDGIDFTCTLKFGRMFWLYLTNSVAIVLTLGMAVPWSKVRLARYRAENMSMTTHGDIEVIAEKSHNVGAGGEAITELFDLDIGL